MKTLQSQRGAIDFILIGVVALLLAGLGGYVYYQQQQNQKIYDQAGSGATVAKKADPTADWVSFTSSEGKFSLKYPKTWFQPENKDQCTAALFETAVYLGPTKDTVMKCGTEYFGQIYVSSEVGDNRADFAYNATFDVYGDISKTPVVVDGVKGERPTATVTKAPEGMAATENGSKEIRYIFFSNNITYRAVYMIPKSNPAPDVTKDFDTMVTKTLKLQ